VAGGVRGGREGVRNDARDSLVGGINPPHDPLLRMPLDVEVVYGRTCRSSRSCNHPLLARSTCSEPLSVKGHVSGICVNGVCPHRV